MSHKLRPRHALLFVLATVFSAAAHRGAEASWAYVPQEVRMAQAQLVVVGELASLAKPVVKDGTEYQVGIIKPIKVLKGKPPEAIRLAWYQSKPGAPVFSAQLPAPKLGDRSIWVLSADDRLPVYWASYPTDRQPVSELAAVEKRLDAVKRIAWSDPVGGVQLAVFVESRDTRDSTVRVNGKVIDALAQLSCYPLVRNASDKPLRWLDYPYETPYSIDFQDPDGQPIEVRTGVEAPRKPPLQKRNFVLIAPGEVRPMGYGFQLGHVTKPGEYAVTLRYASDRDGGELELNNVWTGEVMAPTARIKVTK